MKVTVNEVNDEEKEKEENVEIKMLMRHILNDPKLMEFYQNIFYLCDTNQDGFISINELKSFLETQEEINISEDVMSSIYSKFDKNEDRQLDLKEFIEMINNKTIKETFHRALNRILKFVVIPSIKTKAPLQRTLTATGTYEKEIKCNKNIVGMVLISAIQIICYYVNWSYDKSHENGLLFKALKFNSCQRREIYRYLTYIFLHKGDGHLYGNIILQILIGIPLEMVHTWRVILIYIFGALGGSLTQSVIVRDHGLVGGSAGAFAFMSAHISVVIMNWREMSHPAIQLLVFGVIIIIDFIYTITGNPNSHISYWSHAGGAVVGLLFGVNILRNIRVTKQENIIWYICLVTLGILFTVFAILDIILPLKSGCCMNMSNNCTIMQTIITPKKNS